MFIQYDGDFSSQSIERFVLNQETEPMSKINGTVLDELSDKNPFIVLLYNESNPENIHAYNMVLKYYAQNMNDSTIQQWRFFSCEYGSEEAQRIMPMFGMTDKN